MSEENNTAVGGEAEEELFDLDANIDDVEAAPEFVNPVNGHHEFAVTSCKVKDKRINITYKLLETIEQSNDDDIPSEVGSLCAEGWQRTKQGMEFFKARVKKLLDEDAIKGASISDIVAMLDSDEYQEGYKFSAVTKETTSGEYTNLRFSKIKLLPR